MVRVVRLSTGSALLFVVGFVLCVGSLSCSQTCQGSNPLIDILSTKGVKVFKTAQPSTSPVCKSEWQAFKTCCDSTSLLQYVKADSERLRNSMAEVRKELAQSTQMLKLPIQTIITMFKFPFLKTTVLQEIDLNAIKNMLNHLNLAPVQYAEQAACFQRMTAIRTSSLCYTCSGRSATFFNQGRALMSMQDCQKTISVCGTTWKAMVDLVDGITRVNEIYKLIKKYLPKSKRKAPDMDSAVTLENWLQTTDIRSFLKECTAPGSKCPPKSASNICEDLISLERSTFEEKIGKFNSAKISKFSKITENISKKFNLTNLLEPAVSKPIESKTTNLQAASPFKIQNWQIGRKLHQSQITSQCKFFSQIQVVQDKSTGSGQNGSTSMNFDIGFP